MPACRPTSLQAEIHQEGEFGQHACRADCADILAAGTATKALRDLVESVTVARDDAGIHVMINGRLDVMLGATAFLTRSLVGGKLVAGEGLEPPTYGL